VVEGDKSSFLVGELEVVAKEEFLGEVVVGKELEELGDERRVFWEVRQVFEVVFNIFVFDLGKDCCEEIVVVESE